MFKSKLHTGTGSSNFISLLAIATCFQLMQVSSSTTMSKFAYVGTYGGTTGIGKGIYVYKINLGTGNWSLIQTLEVFSPSFLIFNRQKTHLYAAIEKEEDGEVASYSIDPTNGTLTHLTTFPTKGGSPCHLVFDQEEKHLFVANYGAGSVSVHEVNSTGAVGPQVELLTYEGSGPNKDRQTSAHSHQVSFVPKYDNKENLQVVDLGVDKVLQFQFDKNCAKIDPDFKASWIAEPGAGPRHSVVSSNNKFLYVINELNSSLSVYPNKVEKDIKPLQTVSTLPVGTNVSSFPAEIMFHPSGHFLYGSNRGHNSIAIFSVDQNTGLITPVGHQSTKGNWPRHFQIYDGHMYVGNEKTHTIDIFKINAENGQLIDIDKKIEVPSPACIIIA